MIKHTYKNLVIGLSKEDQYTFGSTDNKINYEKIYFNDDDDGYLPSPHGVRVFVNEKEISKCLVAASGGGTGIHDTCFLFDEDKLLLCCSDSVFCLSLPELNLEWKVKADWATCFQVFNLEKTYIVHGECDISRIDRNGVILWQTSGRDIFVSIDGKDVFEIHSDHILVSDFENTVYKIDLDGNHIEEFKL